MHIEIKQIRPDEWVTIDADLDPSVPHPTLATGKTLAECIENLEQLEKDRGLTPGD